MVSPLTRKLLRDLRSRLGSLTALVLITAVGVACFSGFLSVFQDLDGARERFYRGYRLADFTVTLKRAPTTVLEDLSRLPNVARVEGRVRVPVRLELPGLDEPISALAISLPEDPVPVLNDVMLVRGGWFPDASGRQALLSEAFARARNLKPGDRVRALIMGEQRELVVAGTVKSPEFVYVLPPGGGLVPDPARTGVLFLPHRPLQQWADLDGACNEIVGLAFDRSPAALTATLGALERRLEPYGVLLSDPMSQASSVLFLENELQELKVSATLLPLICLTVVSFVLHVVLGRVIAAQRTVIGTLRALGYTRGAVLQHYLGFAVAVGLAGGLVGAALGRWMQLGMVALYRQYFELPDIRAHYYPSLLALGALVGIAAAVLGTVRAAAGAARMEPAVAMRPPAPERGGKVLVERVAPALWHRLPFGAKMVLRAVLRNPYRSLVTFGTTFVATALMVESLSMVRAVDYMIRHEFEYTSRQDVTLGLRDPVGRGLLSELQALPGLGRVEPQLGVACVLRHGPYEKRVGVTGLSADHVLYRPIDRQGIPVPIPEQGLVLSSKLAEILHVRPGDEVELRPLIGRRERTRAPVSALADTYVGLAAYARIEYLSSLVGEEWVASSILLNTHGRPPDDTLLREFRRRPAVVGTERREKALAYLLSTLGRNIGVFLVILVLFSGGLSFGSVLNTSLVSLSEREREVGTLRVLGYTDREVMGIFAGESYLINGAGIALGLLGGVGFTHLVVGAYSTELFRMPAVIEPRTLVLSAAVMLTFVTLAQTVIYGVVRRTQWLDVFKVRE
ncbi:MAG: ABC transporter permease [Candidatus Eremiobacterota bacterium]